MLLAREQASGRKKVERRTDLAHKLRKCTRLFSSRANIMDFSLYAYTLGGQCFRNLSPIDVIAFIRPLCTIASPTSIATSTKTFGRRGGSSENSKFSFLHLFSFIASQRPPFRRCLLPHGSLEKARAPVLAPAETKRKKPKREYIGEN